MDVKWLYPSAREMAVLRKLLFSSSEPTTYTFTPRSFSFTSAPTDFASALSFLS